MKHLSIPIVLLLAAAVGPALAGPVDSPIPANPCALPLGTLKIARVANEVGTDFGGPVCGVPGAGCAETLTVCHHTGKTGSAAADIVIELFTSAGAPIPLVPPSFQCNVAPGTQASFITTGAIALSTPPYFSLLTTIALFPVAAISQVPLGSLRVLSTNPGKTVCDVTLVDTTAIPLGSVGPRGTKDVTVTKAKTGQKGD